MTPCFKCNRTHMAANNVPHSKKKTRRLMHVNLQPRTINGKRVKVCARCIKTLG